MRVGFTIDEEPQGKGRPRHTKDGHTYTPQKTRDYERLIQLRAKEAMRGKEPIPKGVPVFAKIKAYFLVPKTASLAKKAKLIDDDVYVMKKPDADNIIKAILDACNGIVYHDDAQVQIESCKKYWSGIGSKVEVRIWTEGYYENTPKTS